MDRSLLGLLLMFSAAALPGHARNGDSATLSNEVTIYTQFARPPAALTVEQMKKELDAIMAPVAMHFEWCSLDDETGHHPARELVVVRFRGACQIDEVPTNGWRTGALGWTHVADGQILPFTDVDCDRIRSLMELPLGMSYPAERARLLGRAMARVLAHELYHFLTNTSKHTASGIAKTSFSAAELASTYLRFDEPGLSLVRKHVLRLMPESNPGLPQGQ